MKRLKLNNIKLMFLVFLVTFMTVSYGTMEEATAKNSLNTESKEQLGKQNYSIGTYFRVKGSSMKPTINEGDILKIISLNYEENDLVLANTPNGDVVKRVKGDMLVGDNQEVSDFYRIKDVKIRGKIGKVTASELLKMTKEDLEYAKEVKAYNRVFPPLPAITYGKQNVFIMYSASDPYTGVSDAYFLFASTNDGPVSLSVYSGKEYALLVNGSGGNIERWQYNAFTNRWEALTQWANTNLNVLYYNGQGANRQLLYSRSAISNSVHGGTLFNANNISAFENHVRANYGNGAPTQPGVFTLPTPNISVHKGSNQRLAWGVSTDIRGFPIDYRVKVQYTKNNGQITAEEIVTNSVTTTFVNYQLSMNSDYKQVRFMVEAKNNNTNLYSPIQYSNWYNLLAPLDNNPPQITLSSNPTAWTNGNVTLTINAVDYETGMKRVQLPNGTWVNGATATYPVSQNGIYTFGAEDNLNNQITKSITITNIDKTPPNKATIRLSEDNWTTGDVVATVNHNNDVGSGVKSMEYQLSGATTKSWTPYVNPVVVSANGVTTISVRVTDNVGNTSDTATTVTKDIKIDKTSPTVTLTNNPSTWTNTDVRIIIKGTDSIGEISHIVLPNGNIVYGDVAEYITGTNDRFEFTVFDKAGNSTTVQTDIQHIDKIVPNTPYLSVNVPENTWVNSDAILTILSNGDNGNSGHYLEYKLEGGETQEWTKYTSPYRISLDGITKVSARAVDNAGNISTVVTKTVNIDQNAPSLTVTQNIHLLTNTDVILTAITNDIGSGFKRLQLPNGNWVNTKVTDYTVSQNGTYTFIAEDNFGHLQRVDYKVTNIKKNVLITNKREVLLNLSGEDYLSGITHMRLKNEDLSWTVYETYQNTKRWILTPEDGLKHVWVQYMDKVGNESIEIEDIIILDTKKPVISKFFINNDDLYTRYQSVELTIEGIDALTGIKSMQLSNDNVNWTTVPYTNTSSWRLPDTNGTRTVYVRLVDEAGNISDVMTDTIFLDNVKPFVDISINNGDSFTPVRDVELTLTFHDKNGSGIETVKVIEGTKEYILPKPVGNSPVKIPWTLDFGAVGVVSIVGIDKAGNISDLISDSITIDKLTLERFTLDKVINSLEFNSKKPFSPLIWAFEPQPMLAGADIEFSVDIKASMEPSVMEDKVDYKVEIMDDNGYHKVFMGEMHKQVNHYSQEITLPSDAPKGAKVYVTAVAERKLLVKPFDVQTIYFPNDGAKAQIGFIEGNIQETIQFNETN